MEQNDVALMNRAAAQIKRLLEENSELRAKIQLVRETCEHCREFMGPADSATE